MLSRRDLLKGLAAGAAFGPVVRTAMAQIEDPVISRTDLDTLQELARKTIAAATKAESKAKLGFEAITPGGNYPALWVRDFSMAADSVHIRDDVVRSHLFQIAKSQNGPTARKLGEKAEIPPFAIPDHINYDGGAVFYPGTYSAGDDQGGEPFGVLPPVDDHYEFIHLAHLAMYRAESEEFLKEKVGDLTLFERLEKALDVPTHNPETGMVETDAKRRAVGFGFCDTVYLTGAILFASLLRYRALGEMAEMAQLTKQTKRVGEWNDQRRRISRNLESVFLKNGWLIGATEVGRQPDVWGTAYALCLNAAPGGLARTLRNTLVKAAKEGKITHKGAVRHVPVGLDFSPTSAWERTAGVPINRYQNGAYWHVATGWLVQAIWPADKPLARQIVKDMVEHFWEEGAKGAPWECLHPDQNYRQNPIYMASVTLPLETLVKMNRS